MIIVTTRKQTEAFLAYAVRLHMRGLWRLHELLWLVWHDNVFEGLLTDGFYCECD